MLLEDARGEHMEQFQTTQPTSGGAVTTVTNCCENWVEPSRPQQWVPDLPFFVKFGHVTIESGFVISVINKYMLGSR